jgi:hypothetical protein
MEKEESSDTTFISVVFLVILIQLSYLYFLCQFCVSIDSTIVRSIYNNRYRYIITNTQEVTTHSAAPSKCIHSSDQKFDTDRTSTGKQNITSKYHTTLLHTFICRHPHASPEAGTTAPSRHANRCTISEEIPPTQAHTQLAQSAINK